MKRPVALVTVATLVLMLLAPIVPAHGASPDAFGSPAGSAFHALSRLPDADQRHLIPLTEGELDAVTGMAGWGRGLGLNLGIVVQINVCAVCTDVRQINFGGLGLGLFRASAPR
jgi:hypothetical protein